MTNRPLPLREEQEAAMPIDMLLYCPNCGMQHVDAPEPRRALSLGDIYETEVVIEPEWTNPPHRSHKCQNIACGCIWRPADVPTNGVAELKTAGKADTWPVPHNEEVTAMPAWCPATTPKQEAVTAAVVASGEPVARVTLLTLPDGKKAKVLRALSEKWIVAVPDGTDLYVAPPPSPIPRVADHLEDGGKGWQPIETAPKDGTEILIRYPLQGCTKKLVSWNKVHGYWESKGNPMLGLEFQRAEWHQLPPDAAPADPQRTAIGMRREGS